MLQLLSVVKVACMLVVLPPAPEYQHVHPQNVATGIGGAATLTAGEPISTASPRVPARNTFTIPLIALLLVHSSSVTVDHRHPFRPRAAPSSIAVQRCIWP